MKEIVLKKLKDSGDSYVSGQALSEMLEVSRTAIWKCIGELKKDGYVIDSSSKKGYKLISSPDLLSASEIRYNLRTEILGREVFYFDEIDSTNSYAKKIAAEGCGEGAVVIAECQTAGRGRLGRAWVSGPNKGIWMSIILRPRVLPENVQIITLAASVAVVRALNKVTGIAAGIKWPNDVILDHKKVCGVLTEMSAEMEQINFLVLGIGINVHHSRDDFTGELANVATSLRISGGLNSGGPGRAVTDSFPSRSEIVKNVLLEMEQLYNKINYGCIEEIIREWKRYSVTLRKNVAVTMKDTVYTGIAEDITGDGRLVVRCSDGNTREVLSGEVSVRGILGYV